jgi:hypothetical protein
MTCLWIPPRSDHQYRTYFNDAGALPSRLLISGGCRIDLVDSAVKYRGFNVR